jgi:exopolysaccharide biosynthesis polyprenyl glycosylphosphotransferase
VPHQRTGQGTDATLDSWAPELLARRETRDRPARWALGRWVAGHRKRVAVAADSLATVGGLAIAGGTEALRPAPLLLLVALTLTMLAQAGQYRPRLQLSVLRAVPAIAGRCFVAGVLTSLILQTWLTDVPGALEMGVWTAIAVVVARSAGTAVIRWLRTTRRISHPTLFLGSGKVASDLGAALLSRPEYGLQPVGFLDVAPLDGATDGGLRRLGGLSDLATAVVEHRIDTVIVAFSSAREIEKVELIRACDRLSVEIFIVPRLFELHTVGQDMDSVWGVPLARLNRAAFRSVSWKVKRVMDVVLAGIAVVSLSPLMVACAVAARWETGGVFFRQVRVGLDGRQFEMLKFMSMRPIDDEDAHRTWSIGADARVGSIGRFLRRFSLDELPQLLNVLRGDMSMVGPRPERTYFVQVLSTQFPRYMARHRVPSGLTGWAQVNGLRGDTSIDDRVRFDNYYIENWSLWLDVQILLRTFGQVVRAAGR